MNLGNYELEDWFKDIKTPSTVEEDEAYFRDIQLHVELGVCMDCGAKAYEQGFRTKEEEREFSISGLCSQCQVKYFGK